jgi:hypothetical protein
MMLSSSCTEASAATTTTRPVFSQATTGKASFNLQSPHCQGFVSTIHQALLCNLQTNAATTKRSFTTSTVSEYMNWLILPQTKPNATKGKIIFQLLNAMF